jgi:hypothetical protein
MNTLISNIIGLIVRAIFDSLGNNKINYCQNEINFNTLVYACNTLKGIVDLIGKKGFYSPQELAIIDIDRRFDSLLQNAIINDNFLELSENEINSFYEDCILWQKIAGTDKIINSFKL